MLALVAPGCSNAEAGTRLGLLPETVKSYLRNAARKLGTHSAPRQSLQRGAPGFLP